MGEEGVKMTEKLIMVFMEGRGATAGKAPKAWALPRFWVSICSYKIQPVKQYGVEYWPLLGLNLFPGQSLLSNCANIC